MGVPPILIHVNRIVHYKPSSYGGTTILGNPHVYTYIYIYIYAIYENNA
jgi:hypothetical protein